MRLVVLALALALALASSGASAVSQLDGAVYGQSCTTNADCSGARIHGGWFNGVCGADSKCKELCFNTYVKRGAGSTPALSQDSVSGRVFLEVVCGEDIPRIDSHYCNYY